MLRFFRRKPKANAKANAARTKANAAQVLQAASNAAKAKANAAKSLKITAAKAKANAARAKANAARQAANRAELLARGRVTVARPATLRPNIPLESWSDDMWRAVIKRLEKLYNDAMHSYHRLQVHAHKLAEKHGVPVDVPKEAFDDVDAARAIAMDVGAQLSQAKQMRWEPWPYRTNLKDAQGGGRKAILVPDPVVLRARRRLSSRYMARIKRFGARVNSLHNVTNPHVAPLVRKALNDIERPALVSEETVALLLEELNGIEGFLTQHKHITPLQKRLLKARKTIENLAAMHASPNNVFYLNNSPRGRTTHRNRVVNSVASMTGSGSSPRGSSTNKAFWNAFHAPSNVQAKPKKKLHRSQVPLGSLQLA